MNSGLPSIGIKGEGSGETEKLRNVSREICSAFAKLPRQGDCNPRPTRGCTLTVLQFHRNSKFYLTVSVPVDYPSEMDGPIISLNIQESKDPMAL